MNRGYLIRTIRQLLTDLRRPFWYVDGSGGRRILYDCVLEALTAETLEKIHYQLLREFCEYCGEPWSLDHDCAGKRAECAELRRTDDTFMVE